MSSVVIKFSPVAIELSSVPIELSSLPDLPYFGHLAMEQEAKAKFQEFDSEDDDFPFGKQKPDRCLVIFLNKEEEELLNLCFFQVQTAMESALVTAMTRIMGEKVAILIRRNKNVKEITDIEEKMEKLKELLLIVNMVIQDVESRPFTYDVKILSRKLRYLVYDLEDVVDCYDTEVLRKQRSRASFRSVHDFFSSNNQILFKSRLGSMIKAVTESGFNFTAKVEAFEFVTRQFLHITK
ncbi:hypothetical protein ZIOFF_041723 [Zingiber officinale]|uniref:Disease resistance N-terminal domain-containing protein n=1 Tax=Zingiber officinale TaxID=94328 RepID=A0A8J5GBV8_ZINOF|nr:hypothetical protein ZIOFF_041723 [Zingiber officinale]